ncbi:hypothetical protein CHS0354_012969 [Potamilus streckersoni]|uniref:Uncharacterized protein n=1 Tax=Potamilus streckersoni TaxID=2493646 RepID=A0AAE0VI76_9BIVA|nr:hypothetical protein CHS0354_012969 [Potamilus streckersoni]
MMFSVVVDEIKDHRRVGKPTKKTRDESVKRLMTEFKSLNGETAKYPVANSSYRKLKDVVKNAYKDSSKLTIELTQTSFDGFDKTDRMRLDGGKEPISLSEIIKDAIKYIKYEDSTVKIIGKIHALLQRPTNQELSDPYLESRPFVIFRNDVITNVVVGIMRDLKEKEKDQDFLLLRQNEPDYDIDEIVDKIIQNYDKQVDEFTEKGIWLGFQ